MVPGDPYRKMPTLLLVIGDWRCASSRGHRGWVRI